MAKIRKQINHFWWFPMTVKRHLPSNDWAWRYVNHNALDIHKLLLWGGWRLLMSHRKDHSTMQIQDPFVVPLLRRHCFHSPSNGAMLRGNPELQWAALQISDSHVEAERNSSNILPSPRENDTSLQMICVSKKGSDFRPSTERIKSLKTTTTVPLALAVKVYYSC